MELTQQEKLKYIESHASILRRDSYSDLCFLSMGYTIDNAGINEVFNMYSKMMKEYEKNNLKLQQVVSTTSYPKLNFQYKLV